MLILEINSIFNFEKANEYFLEAYNLAKENKSIIKKNKKSKSFTKELLYSFQTAGDEPAAIAFWIGEINLNLYQTSSKKDYQKIMEPYIDHEKGLKYLTIASNGNHSEALHTLGKIYLEGIFGAKKNEKKAFNLINKSILLGRTRAHKDLADFYLLGNGGVKKNYSKALMHYKLGNIHKFSGAEGFYDIAILHKHERLPKDSKEYYSWLLQDLLNFKSISSIERAGYIAILFLKNYSEAYKWYHICSLKIKSNDWNQNFFGFWGRNINKRCSQKIAYLEKYLLKEKEINSAKIAADKWKKEFIN